MTWKKYLRKKITSFEKAIMIEKFSFKCFRDIEVNVIFFLMEPYMFVYIYIFFL